MSDATLEDLPAEARPTFDLLFAQPLTTEADMKARVEAYMDILRAARERGKDVDLGSAEKLADRSRRMLDAITPATSERDRRLMHSAVRYFLHPSEAQRDWTTGGLDDDVAVMNVVARALDRADLLIH